MKKLPTGGFKMGELAVISSGTSATKSVSEQPIWKIGERLATQIRAELEEEKIGSPDEGDKPCINDYLHYFASRFSNLGTLVFSAKAWEVAGFLPITGDESFQVLAVQNPFINGEGGVDGTYVARSGYHVFRLDRHNVHASPRVEDIQVVSPLNVAVSEGMTYAEIKVTYHMVKVAMDCDSDPLGIRGLDLQEYMTYFGRSVSQNSILTFSRKASVWAGWNEGWNNEAHTQIVDNLTGLGAVKVVSEVTDGIVTVTVSRTREDEPSLDPEANSDADANEDAAVDYGFSVGDRVCWPGEGPQDLCILGYGPVAAWDIQSIDEKGNTQSVTLTPVCTDETHSGPSFEVSTPLADLAQARLWRPLRMPYSMTASRLPRTDPDCSPKFCASFATLDELMIEYPKWSGLIRVIEFQAASGLRYLVNVEEDVA